MKLFTIDASTTSCGWAVFDGKCMEASGVVTDDDTDPFSRCSAISKTMYYLVSEYGAEKVICEYPHKGGPGMRSKTITILFHFCGMLHAYMNHIDIPVEFIEPSIWKGQVPKEKHHPKLIKRIEKLFGSDATDYSGDTLDAIGIGLWELWDRKLKKPAP